MRYKCARCHTEYYSPGECDWCPGVQRTELLEGPCETRLQVALRHIRKLEVKAAKWDLVTIACHRLGAKCREVIDYVNERIRG